MWGLGKKRTPLGKWLDRNGLTQQDLHKESKVSRKTITAACNDPDYYPTASVMKKLLKAVRKVDPEVKSSNFWDM